MSRALQASNPRFGACAPVSVVGLQRLANRSLSRPRTTGLPGLPLEQQRAAVVACARKEDTKGEQNVQPQSADPSSSELSPFFEPLLRGLVLGIGAGVICEMAHVAFKVTNIASVGGYHMPSGAQLYEQLAPLFVWDHAVAIFFWLLFYVIEAGAILAILREYPDDKQAFRIIRSTPTLPKRLMPLKLSSVKRTIHALLHGRLPQEVSTEEDGDGEVAVRPEQQQEPTNRARTAESRRAAGLRPGQWDPRAAPPLLGRGADGKEPLGKVGAGRGGGWSVECGGLGAVRCGCVCQKKAAKRAKELEDRKAYLQNFWYAAALSDNVTSKPLQVYCLDDVCPHRGAPLSLGWTKTSPGGKSCVVCPYHGWAFTGEGALEEVPSQSPEVGFPRRPVVDSYPVVERGGFVWLFFGSKSLPADERPPIPVVPELEDPNWRPVYGELEFDCPHWSVFENALDMAHIHYIHNGSFGNQDKPIIHDMKVTRDTWSVTANFSSSRGRYMMNRIHNKPVNPFWNFAAVDAVPVEARAYLPSTSYVKITLGAGIQMITFVNTVPIDEHRAINRFCLIRNFLPSPVFDDYTRKNMFKILGEDKAMIELLKPEQLAAELSLQADKPQIAFRKLRQEWIDMGYGVAPERISGHTGSLRLDM
ncbi:hypothetical protein VOLCADRAFT_88044 [Volvox carteri f. nagariensis]|uniref:Rieske domain-containing protein n=1 Tax=Volvox carteri f. nagariensis TaxID=3068 RepID=D8TMX6_VOLCA|nr:uncharacterized protein VOLCADRAFT_88044 [Volvox carteri f. nagariensis]EFJ51327.1 hypothetical protein VOLCADRAFT_88044 [Volvox carteri f. nagariensis]|eukprot:XP_002947794.1 hypothetical protein VOLCADRAFT_88044 [Volvox carteri f. nagariensis]